MNLGGEKLILEIKIIFSNYPLLSKVSVCVFGRIKLLHWVIVAKIPRNSILG